MIDRLYTASIPEFDFNLDISDEDFIRVQNYYQNASARRAASSRLPATGEGIPSSHHSGQPLPSTASSQPVRAINSALPTPLYPSTPASIPPTSLLAHPGAASSSQQQYSTSPSTCLPSSTFPLSSTPRPGSQPTYGAIVERYRSSFRPGSQATQTVTQPMASSSSSATAHLPLSLGVAAAPRFQGQHTAPLLSTASVNQARMTSARATLPQHQQLAPTTRRRGRPPATSSPGLPGHVRKTIGMCRTPTGDLNVMIKVYPPTVSIFISHFSVYSD